MKRAGGWVSNDLIKVNEKNNSFKVRAISWMFFVPMPLICGWRIFYDKLIFDKSTVNLLWVEFLFGKPQIKLKFVEF